MRSARFILAITFLILLGACSAKSMPPTQSSEPPPSPAVPAKSQTSVFPSKPVPVMKARVIPVTAENFAFTPSAIRVKKGEKVVIHLTGKSGIHGFAVPELSVNVPVAAGQTVDVALPTDQAGTFGFLCSIPCGEGHKDMKGTITIEN